MSSSRVIEAKGLKDLLGYFSKVCRSWQQLYWGEVTAIGYRWGARVVKLEIKKSSKGRWWCAYRGRVWDSEETEPGKGKGKNTARQQVHQDIQETS